MLGRGRHTCVFFTPTSCSVLLRRVVRRPGFNNFTVAELLWVPSGDTCRAYELGIHGRHPARCGAKMLLKPRELDYYH